MATGYQQRHKGKFRLIVFQHGCQQVALHVMHPQRRHTPTPGQRSRQGRPYHQRPHQSGACGVSHPVYIGATATGLSQHLLKQRQYLAHMVAGGQFRHHATILHVNIHLAEQGVRQ